MTPQPINDVVLSLCATVPDYPKPGILFRDLTPVLADASAFPRVIRSLLEPFEGTFDRVAGVEARGFLLASAAAYASGTGVSAIRKPGKLPREVFSEAYALEYGTAAVEIHRDEFEPGTRVLILDDVLATGGTLAAAVQLVRRAGAEVVGAAVVLELSALKGRNAIPGRVESLAVV